MWQNYETNYSATLADDSFLSWRDMGARQKALNIVRVCDPVRIKSVVEIGCGTGAILRFLHSMGFAERYACIDVAFSAVQFARQSCRNFVEGAFVGLADALPFQDVAFDVAILSHVLEHLEDPVLALKEASRVARFVAVEVPTEDVLSNAIRTKLFGRPYSSTAGAGHLHFWSPKSIASFLRRDCGLQIIREHRDLISKEVEFFGKEGPALAKPLLKQALKAALPSAVYSRLLTTHATFLCTRSASEVQMTIGMESDAYGLLSRKGE